jgi:hypothetical protein
MIDFLNNMFYLLFDSQYNISKIALLNVLIIYILFVFGLIFVVYKKRNSLMKIIFSLSKLELFFIFLIIFLRILMVISINPSIGDVRDDQISNCYTYKEQGKLFTESIPFFDKSTIMVNAHIGHPIAYGTFIGFLYVLFGVVSTKISVVLNIFLSILSSIFIFIFLNNKKNLNNINNNKKKLNTFTIKNGFISVLFLLLPLVYLNSSITSPVFFATFFLVIFYILYYYWNTISNKKLRFLYFFLMIQILCLIVNIKMEYATTTFALCLLFLFRFFKERKIFSRLEKIQFFLSPLYLFFINLQIFYNYHFDTGTKRFGFDKIIPSLYDLFQKNHYILIFLLIIFIVIIFEFYFKKKKGQVYLDFVLTLLFYLYSDHLTMIEIRYWYVIFIAFILPFMLISNLNTNFKIIILLLLIILQFNLYPNNYDLNESIEYGNLINEINITNSIVCGEPYQRYIFAVDSFKYTNYTDLFRDDLCYENFNGRYVIFGDCISHFEEINMTNFNCTKTNFSLTSERNLDINRTYYVLNCS